MKFSFFVLVILILTSCGKNLLETESKVEPLFAAQKLSQRYGNGKTNTLKIKIPLTKDTIGHYDYSQVAEDNSVNKLQKSVIQSFMVNLKYTLFNWGVGMGISNRVKYSTLLDIPTIDPEYFDIIQSIKINKIFFTLLPCDSKEQDCLTRKEESYPVSFAFLEKFFVNLSMVASYDNLEFIKNPLKFLSSNEFNNIANKSFRQIPLEFHNLGIQDGEIVDDFFKDVNLTKFQNEKSMREFQKNVRDDGSIFLFSMSKGQVAFIKELNLEKFKKYVKDSTIIGKSVYVELKHKDLKAPFFSLLNSDQNNLEKRGIENTIGCSYVNCLTPKVNPINFIPLFKKSNTIKMDTYLSIRHLDYNDFKYKGFVEFEVVLNLPI